MVIWIISQIIHSQEANLSSISYHKHSGQWIQRSSAQCSHVNNLNIKISFSMEDGRSAIQIEKSKKKFLCNFSLFPVFKTQKVHATCIPKFLKLRYQHSPLLLFGKKGCSCPQKQWFFVWLLYRRYS